MNILVHQKPDPQPSIYLVRMGEKANEVSKKKLDLLLRDIKTIDFAPTTNDNRQQSALRIEFTTAERDHSFIALTFEEKKAFLINLRKVCKRK
jgi:hypothetical protein